MDPGNPKKTICDIQCLYMEGLRKSQKLKFPPGRPTKALYLKKFQELMLPLVDLSGAKVDESYNTHVADSDSMLKPLEHNEFPDKVASDTPSLKPPDGPCKSEEDDEHSHNSHVWINTENKDVVKKHLLSSGDCTIFGVADTSSRIKHNTKTKSALFPTNVIQPPPNKCTKMYGNTRKETKPIKRLQGPKKQSSGTGRAYAKIYKFLKTMPHKHLQGKLAPPSKSKRPTLANDSMGHSVRKQLKIEGSSKCVETTPRTVISQQVDWFRTDKKEQAKENHKKQLVDDVPPLQKPTSIADKSCVLSKSETVSTSDVDTKSHVSLLVQSTHTPYITPEVACSNYDPTPQSRRSSMEITTKESCETNMEPLDASHGSDSGVYSRKTGSPMLSNPGEDSESCEVPKTTQAVDHQEDSIYEPMEDRADVHHTESQHEAQQKLNCRRGSDADTLQECIVSSHVDTHEHASGESVNEDSVDLGFCDEGQVSDPDLHTSTSSSLDSSDRLGSRENSPLIPLEACTDRDSVVDTQETQSNTKESESVVNSRPTFNSGTNEIQVQQTDVCARHEIDRKPALEVAQDIVNEHAPSKHLPDMDQSATCSLVLSEASHNVHSSIAKALKVARQRILDSHQSKIQNNAHNASHPSYGDDDKVYSEVKDVLGAILDQLDVNVTINTPNDCDKLNAENAGVSNIQYDMSTNDDISPVVQHLVNKLVEDASAASLAIHEPLKCENSECNITTPTAIEATSTPISCQVSPQTNTLHDLSGADSNDGLHIDEDCLSVVDAVPTRKDNKLNMVSRLQLCTGSKRSFVRRRQRKRGKFKLTMPSKRRTIDERKVPKLRLVSTDTARSKDQSQSGDESMKSFAVISDKMVEGSTEEMETQGKRGQESNEKRDVKRLKRKLYPRRHSIVYTSDIPVIPNTKEDPDSVAARSKHVKKRRKSLTGEIVNSDKTTQEDKQKVADAGFTDNRLSMEFPKYNWVLEKYKNQLQSPDVSALLAQPHISPEADKKNKPKMKRKSTTKGEANSSQSDVKLKGKRTKKRFKKLQKEVMTKKDESPKESPVEIPTTSMDIETDPDIETSGNLRILEVVSLAGFLQDEKDEGVHGTSTDVGVPDYNSSAVKDPTSAPLSITTKCEVTNTNEDPATVAKTEPEDCSVKSSLEDIHDEELQPLDLSVKSVSALDLRKKDGKTDVTEASYNCFDVRSLNNHTADHVVISKGKFTEITQKREQFSVQSEQFCAGEARFPTGCSQQVHAERARSYMAQSTSNVGHGTVRLSANMAGFSSAVPKTSESSNTPSTNHQSCLPTPLQLRNVCDTIKNVPPLLDDHAASTSADRNMVTPPDKIFKHEVAVMSSGPKSISNRVQTSTSASAQIPHGHMITIAPSLTGQNVIKPTTEIVASVGVQQTAQRILPALKHVSSMKTPDTQHIPEQSQAKVVGYTSSTTGSPHHNSVDHSKSEQPQTIPHAARTARVPSVPVATTTTRDPRRPLVNMEHGITNIPASVQQVRLPFLPGASFLQTSNMLRGHGHHSISDSNVLIYPPNLRPSAHISSTSVETQSIHLTRISEKSTSNVVREASSSNSSLTAPVSRVHQSPILSNGVSVPSQNGINGIRGFPHAPRHPIQANYPAVPFRGAEPRSRQNHILATLASETKPAYVMTERPAGVLPKAIRQNLQGVSRMENEPTRRQSVVVPSRPNMPVPQYPKNIQRNDRTYQQVTRPTPKSVSQSVSVQTKEGTVVMPLGHINCESCSKRANFLCSGCKRVAYCSPECQFFAWKTHKNRCG